MKIRRAALRTLASVIAVSIPAVSLHAQTLYSQNFDADDTPNWTINVGPTDESANFFFDYSAVGIPSAPSSGGSTRGMRLAANITDAIFGGFSVSPNGQAFSGDYTLSFDLWNNFIGNRPAGVGTSADGSTMLSLFGILTSGTTANFPGAADGVWFGATGDGGSAADYRAYSSERNTSYIPGGTDPNDPHANHFAGGRNNTAALYADNYGGVSPPAAQTALYPETQVGTTVLGSMGLEWHRVEIVKNGLLATWKMDGVALIEVDMSNFTVATGGNNILFGHSDINTGISTDPDYDDLSFTLIDNITVSRNALIGTWNVDLDGNWSDPANWSNGVVPNAAGAVANFGGAIQQPRTVNVTSPQIAGVINFDSGVAYTIAGASAVTLDNGTSPAEVNVINGSHTIAAPLTLASDTTFTVTPAGGSLLVSGQMTAAGRSITKAGAGAVEFRNVRAASLNVSAGTARISANPSPNSPAGASVVGALSIAGSAELNLANNTVIIDYAGPVGSLVTDVRNHLASSRLTSSGADSTKRLGYADTAVIGAGTFAGQQVDGSSVVVMFTLAGDANLNGTTNINDFSNLAANFNSPGVWSSGDFNYDGTTNIQDFSLLASNFNRTLAADLSRASVPEPAAAAAATGIGMLAMVCRRTRRAVRTLVR